MKGEMRMLKKSVTTAFVIGGAALVLTLPGHLSAAKAKPVKMANDGRAKCYECHDEIKAMKEGSKHASLPCKSCHDKLDTHVNNPEKKQAGDAH
jgi:hypothetical protein